MNIITREGGKNVTTHRGKTTASGVDTTTIFFFQAEDGIRDDLVTGVQTCALPIGTPMRPRSALMTWQLLPSAACEKMRRITSTSESLRPGMGSVDNSR